MDTHAPLPAAQRFLFWRLCAWGGPIFLVGYVFSWAWLGMNLPPLSPDTPQADLYAHYSDHGTRLRIAYTLSVFFMPFYFAFSSVVSRLMQRIEGPEGPMSIVEQMGGATTTVVGMVAGICWSTAAFRVDQRSPALVQALHDYGWLFFDTTYMVTGLQMLAMAVVFLADRRAVKLVPAWLSWYTVFVVLAFLPLSLLPHFTSGPFAWNGAVCYWVSLGSWFVWLMLLCVQVFKAIHRLEHEGIDTVPADTAGRVLAHAC